MADIKIQRGVTTVDADAETATLGAAVSSLDNAFVVITGNRQVGSGASTGNTEGDDLAVQARLTGTSTITFDRPASTPGINTIVRWEVWEYTGAASGANEFIVRSRDELTETGGSDTATLSNTPDDIDACIPFINGAMTSDTGNGANGMSVRAWLSGSNTLNGEWGEDDATTKTMHVTTVEFTGANWSVGHGTVTGQTADSGTISLVTAAAGTGGSTFTVTDWTTAIIASWGHAGDGSNEAIADLWPLLSDNTSTSVAYTFNSNHDGSDDDITVHILQHDDLTVTRFEADTSNTSGVSNVDITSAGLTDLGESSVLGTSISSGTGTAYARGWRGYRLTSTTNAEHHCGRSGNTMAHYLQVIDWTAVAAAGDATATPTAFQVTSTRDAPGFYADAVGTATAVTPTTTVVGFPSRTVKNLERVVSTTVDTVVVDTEASGDATATPTTHVVATTITVWSDRLVAVSTLAATATVDAPVVVGDGNVSATAVAVSTTESEGEATRTASSAVTATAVAVTSTFDTTGVTGDANVTFTAVAVSTTLDQAALTLHVARAPPARLVAATLDAPVVSASSTVAGGGVAVTTTIDAATVLTGNDALVTPSAAAVTGFFGVWSDRLVTSDDHGVSTTVPTVTVATTGDATAVLTAVAVTTTTDQPTATGDANRTLTAVQAATTVDSPALSAGASVAGGDVAVTTTVDTVTVIAGGDVTKILTAVVVNGTAIDARNRIIYAAYVAVAATIDTPTVDVGATVTATAVAVTTTTDQPTATGDANRTLTAVAVTTTADTPTVLTGNDATATPTVLVVTATVTTWPDRLVAPSSLVVGTTLPAVSVGTPATVTTTAVAVQLVNWPDFSEGFQGTRANASSTVTPSAATVTTTIDTPSTGTATGATATLTAVRVDSYIDEPENWAVSPVAVGTFFPTPQLQYDANPTTTALVVSTTVVEPDAVGPHRAVLPDALVVDASRPPAVGGGDKTITATAVAVTTTTDPVFVGVRVEPAAVAVTTTVGATGPAAAKTVALAAVVVTAVFPQVIFVVAVAGGAEVGRYYRLDEGGGNYRFRLVFGSMRGRAGGYQQPATWERVSPRIRYDNSTKGLLEALAWAEYIADPGKAAATLYDDIKDSVEAAGFATRA